jgi:hypothetical protein
MSIPISTKLKWISENEGKLVFWCSGVQDANRSTTFGLNQMGIVPAGRGTKMVRNLHSHHRFFWKVSATQLMITRTSKTVSMNGSLCDAIRSLPMG